MATKTDPFAALLPDTAVIAVQNKKAVDVWEGEIPDSALQWAELGITAYETNATDRRVELPCKDEGLAKSLHSAIKAAVSKLNGHLTAYTTVKRDKETGEPTHFSFVVGKPRGRNKDTEEN